MGHLQHLREAGGRKGVTSSDCMGEDIRGTNVLNVGNPRPGISLGECPCDNRAERSNQEEPKQTFGSVSETTREIEEGQLERTAWMAVSKTNAMNMTESGTY